MEVLGLLGLLVFLYWFIAPAAAWVRASALKAKVEVLERMLATQAKELASLRRQVLILGEQGSAGVATAPADTEVAAATAAAASTPAAASTAPADTVPTAANAATAAPARQPPPAQRSERAVFELEPLSPPAPVTAAPDVVPDQPVLDIRRAAASARPDEPAARDKSPASAAWSLEPIEETPEPAEASDATAPSPLAASVAEPVVATQSPAKPADQAAPKAAPSAATPRPQTASWQAPRRQPARPRPPAPPSAVEQFLQAAKGWLFGGNLVAKIGLMILFIGVAFLLRYASNYVVVPIEFRLAGIALGAIALLGWGWRIRERRPGIALPVQGAALATLMLVTFGAYKIYGLLPPLPTFALLLLLVLFTCVLAVLQNALWLAVFGIVGGFAVPILTSSGDGNHIALFSYYALLNGGILAIAWHRAWRVLNVLGFLFTFLIGSAWGVLRYEPEHYASAQAFLALFLLFYIAIAVLYAWRQAPKLKSTVDATLVFGVPTVAMALQFGLVREFHLGAALSALAMGLLYALVAMALWRWRSGSLRLLIESFFAVAVVFGTLAIPLAFDGRWTSAAWALQGAGMVWLGLRQKQALVWRFGIALQLGSWVAFMVALSDLDPLGALRGHISLGFLLLGGSALFLALCFLQRTRAEGTAGAIGTLATAFVGVAVCWLLAGLWVEVWLRVTGVHRASMLVLTALLLVLGLQWLARRAQWRVPDVLAGAVTALASVVFLALMLRYLRWDNVAVYSEQSLGEILSNSGLLGAALLSGGALASAFAFKRQMLGLQAQVLDASGPARAAGGWLLLAAFWWCGFALYGGAHVLAWLTSAAAGDAEPWYRISFLAGYAIALALSAYGWMALAWRFDFPNRGWMLTWFWPALSALGAWIYLLQVTPALRTEHALDFRWALAPAGDGSVVDAHLALLGGPLLGGLILLLLCWIGLRWMAREHPAIGAEQRSSGTVIWMIGLIAVAYLLPLDALAQWTTQTLLALDVREDDIRAWLGYADARLIWTGALAAAALALSRSIGPQALRWLALPAAALLALAWLVLVGRAYLIHEAPATGTLLALLLAWLAQAWCMAAWLQRWPMPRPSLQALHWVRVIAPWLLLAPVVSAYLMPWLAGASSPAAAEGWVLAGMWPDYLAAWLALALLFAGLRQVRREGWPLAPLQLWYGNLVIPLAALMMLLQVVYWNLRQDGSMAPLPYLPLLNPLDLSSAFVALLLFDLWRTQRERIGTHAQRLLQRGAMALAFGWFNLMLLRTAAQYLQLPYRFAALYQSQFVQAMLSLVWTLCAFALMRYAVRRMSKPLWMLGAALLAVVVLKLFLVDLRNVGGIARIVSFMGVGGLMLLIGYLAPLPTQPEPAREQRP